MRSTLNNLARVYKVETLAVLEPPGRAERARHEACGAARRRADWPATSSISPARNAAKAMWANAECVARCVRDGDKVVLVTEEGKVYQISNQDKITAESYGQMVTLTGKTERRHHHVESLKM